MGRRQEIHCSWLPGTLSIREEGTRVLEAEMQACITIKGVEHIIGKVETEKDGDQSPDFLPEASWGLSTD